jgi:5-deoxy-glucuronate isomerase
LKEKVTGGIRLIIKQKEPFGSGYTPITCMDDNEVNAMMDFGILMLSKGESFSCSEEKERAYLLIRGEARLEWSDRKETVRRDSFLEEGPWCLHLPAGESVKITALADDTEISVTMTDNPGVFSPKFYSPQDCRIEEFGKGTAIGETSTRIVRTVFDFSNAPYANLVVGEVVNYPGKWSSYPPHHHPQPEIYFYKFYPEQGFGYSENGEDVYKARNNDTAVITGGKTHSQVAAPGYAMYYIWVIRNLENNPFDERIFIDEHKWLLAKDAKVWPEK